MGPVVTIQATGKGPKLLQLIGIVLVLIAPFSCSYSEPPSVLSGLIFGFRRKHDVPRRSIHRMVAARLMNTIVMLLSLFATSALAQGAKELQPSPAVAFKSVPIGASGADLVSAYPWIDCPGGGDDQVCTLSPKNCNTVPDSFGKCMSSMTYGGVPITSVDFRLFYGRVALISVKVESGHFDRLLEAMLLRFGKPTKSGTNVFRSATGLEVPSDYYHWARGGGQVSASRFGSDLGHSSVSLVTPPGVAEAERLHRLDIEAGARDL